MLSIRSSSNGRHAAVAIVAGLLEAGIAIGFAALDSAHASVPTALGILVAALAAALAGPVVGVVVALVGWALFFLLVADAAAWAALALPAWVAVALVVGVIAQRLGRAEKERRLTRSEVAAIREAAAEGVVTLALDGTILDWSAGAARIYGYAPEEVEGQPISLLEADGGSAGVGELLDRVRRGERVEEHEAVHRRKNGEEVTVSLSASPVAAEGEAVGACLVVSDVGARAQEQLREAELGHRALVEQLPLVTYAYGLDGRRSPISVSPQVERLLGYSPDEWVADPELFSRLLHPDDRERVLADVEAATADGEFRAEYRLRARGGKVVTVRDEARVIRDAKGLPLYMQGYLLDVSQRKRTETERERLLAAERFAAAEAVRKQERLDFLASASEILASSLDYRTTVRRVAELAVRALADWCVVDVVAEGDGLERLAVAHAELRDRQSARAPLLDPEPGPRVARVVQNGRAEIIPPLSGRAAEGGDVTAFDGIACESYVCAPLLARGRALGAISLVSSRPRRAYGADELALANDLARRVAGAIENARLYREVEERAEADRVLTYVSDGVFLVDRGGVIRFWNPAAEAITNLPASSVLGRTASEAIPSWDRVVDRIPVRTPSDPGDPETVPIETEERGERWLSISGVEFFGGIVYAFRDITAARRLEELKAEFVATASHELRTPLAAVYGAAQTLRRHDFALDEGGRERFVSLIVEESDRLSRIVNEILLANQLDLGRLDLAAEPFDPAELVERVVESARTHARPDVSLDVVARDSVPSVAADRDKVRQVLVNLVENAIKYSPQGGKIHVGVEPQENAVRFFVSDEGIGIPPDEQERIFEKFYRLDPDLTHGIGGTGLGLYICKELVARMGGRIWVESSEERGSTFAFELPLAELTAPRPIAAGTEL